MPTEDPTKLLYDFRASYGRLCHLTCKALYDGEDKAMVHRAFSGDRFSPFTKITAAYALCDVALKRAGQRIPQKALVQHAYEVRIANEKEWMVEIDARVAV